MSDTPSADDTSADTLKTVKSCCGVSKERATNAAPELSHLEVRTFEKPDDAEPAPTDNAADDAEADTPKTSGGGCCCGPKS